MVRLSNSIVSTINIVTLVVSLTTLASSIWFRTHPTNACQTVLQKPLLVLGISLFVVSLLGLIGSCCRVQSLLWVYLFVMFVLIVGLAGFTIFTLTVTNKGVGKAVSGIGFEEYRLGDYSNWLRKYVVKGENWDNIRKCLVESTVCSSLGGDPNGHRETAAEFYKRKLSPTQSGCCKPPTACNFEFRNATLWAIPVHGPAGRDPDCTAWSNNQSKLCFNCESCKAGVLANIKKEWRSVAIFNGCVLVFVIIVYCIGCCALKNNRSDRHNESGDCP